MSLFSNINLVNYKIVNVAYRMWIDEREYLSVKKVHKQIVNMIMRLRNPTLYFNDASPRLLDHLFPETLLHFTTTWRMGIFPISYDCLKWAIFTPRRNTEAIYRYEKHESYLGIFVWCLSSQFFIIFNIKHFYNYA